MFVTIQKIVGALTKFISIYVEESLICITAITLSTKSLGMSSYILGNLLRIDVDERVAQRSPLHLYSTTSIALVVGIILFLLFLIHEKDSMVRETQRLSSQSPLSREKNPDISSFVYKFLYFQCLSYVLGKTFSSNFLHQPEKYLLIQRENIYAHARGNKHVYYLFCACSARSSHLAGGSAPSTPQDPLRKIVRARKIF